MQETDQKAQQNTPETPVPAEVKVEPPASKRPRELVSEFSDESLDDPDQVPQPLTPASRQRILLAIAVIVVLGLSAILPPLVNVNRYQHRIAQSISASLGRPVQIDSVTLNLLPMPGFTLKGFVVSEDPAFGYEPVIRANTVKATLRMRSLWHRRVEFSRIALEDPSVNLVRRADGKWNIEGILLQASRIPVIATEEKASTTAGVQRFPYIEATGARLNIKEGLEKKPLSLTEAEFAVWLPQQAQGQPQTWHVRVEARPTRTDTAASDTGIFRVEGTLGKADRLEDVPIDLHTEWVAAPLGAASWIMMGRDAGVRGEMTVRAAAKGTIGQNAATAQLELRRLRRADFVPADPLEVNLDCKARATGVFRQLTGLQCGWSGVDGGGVTVSGDVPDTHDLKSAQLQAKWQEVRITSLADTLRVASSRDSSRVHASGLISGEASCCSGTVGDVPGTFQIVRPRVAIGDSAPLVDQTAPLQGQFTDGGMTMTPIALNLGGAEPATLTLSADPVAFHMHLSGGVLRSHLMALATALPQFGDGLQQALPRVAAPVVTPKALETPMRVDLTATRTWANAGVQSWAATPHAPPAKRARRRR
jgi:AsmA protein